MKISLLRFQFGWLRSVVLAGALAAFSHVALSCGLNWGEPRSKIEGCNEQGYVLIAEKLAELTIPGEKLAFPIWATFDSSRQRISPYAGQSWSIPFIESHMVQISEGEFMWMEPTGWKRLFRRDAKNSDILNGGGGWKGQLSKDRVTLWADCGWRVDLQKGRIVSMKMPQNQAISYNYANGRVASVTCDGKTLLTVDPADGANGTLDITIDGKHYTLAKTEHPRVERIAGVNVIAGKELGFHQWTGSETQSRTFTYSVDDQLNPTITITNKPKPDTVIAWNPETRRITRYGNWKYDIKPNENPVENAAIERVNGEGEKEYWFRDGPGGQETIELDGVREITTRFVSGVANGGIRKKERIKDGEVQVIYQASYNEAGRIAREVMEGGRVNQYNYSPEGKLLTQTCLVNGTTSLVMSYTEKGKLAAIREADGRTKEFFYDDKGRENKILINGKLHSESTYAPDGKWKKDVVYDRDSGVPARTFYREFDDYGRISLDKFTEHKENGEEVVEHHFYNALGQLEKRVNSRDGTYIFTKDQNGKKITQHIKELTNPDMK